MGMLSVIIPVYNVEGTLDRCVLSVTGQTFESLEIILVDDGSPDSCPLLCDGWAHRDSRIKVIHKKNGGLSSARNAGLDIATGEWVTFVDSDDWL
jgi:glycosyltransferase involved in cell wall biosynthesis